MKKPIVKDFQVEDPLSRLEAKNQFDGHLVYGSRSFHTSTHRSTKSKSGPADGKIHAEQELVVSTDDGKNYTRIPEFWEDVDVCPVCQSTSRSFWLTRYGLDIYCCEDCSHNYMHPRIKFEKLVKLYAQDETAFRIYASDAQVDLDIVKSKYGLNLLDKFGVPDQDRIMDLGCGSGKFLETALSHGWSNCIGVDANPTFKDFHSDNGVKFIYSNFEALDMDAIGEGYSAITLWNVLEHLYDLGDVVKRMHSMLKKDGLLFIMVPNVQSLASRLIREKSATFNWKHVAHFTPSSLEKLMKDGGFKTELLETSITEIENVKSYMNGQWPYSGYNDPDGLFNFITPQYIHDNMLGSRIIGLFRK